MRLLSGIQPSGNITLGNYLGALKNFVKLQDKEEITDFLVFVADMHAITVPQDKQALRQNIKSLVATYLACGLNPEKVHIFIQSEVPAHAQLGWVLQCNGYIGELERMTQFKDKKEKQVAGVSVGLLTYPSLMAPYIAEAGAKVMSLTEPTKKMSKSDPNPKAYIALLDDINVAKKKIKSAITDSDGKIAFDTVNKPGISNLLTILSCLTNTSIKDLVEKYKDSNYATFKEDVANAVANELEPIQKRYNELINSPKLDEILNEGRDYANYLANKKISKVYNKVGLGRKTK